MADQPLHALDEARAMKLRRELIVLKHNIELIDPLNDSPNDVSAVLYALANDVQVIINDLPATALKQNLSMGRAEP